ncbi:MAG: nucleotidyl transferase AbiEii/AbiGii toxin family protein [Deltaproteobacteria bacterium]|nr:nucleotidyl transferase AbiEii/AbiGii toxin family protein [Deltaproteobacteria bacterium]
MSSHEAENLNVKVEVNPTEKKYPTEPKTISEDRFSFVIRHYDIPTLMAGKMAACLERIWEKGKTGIKIKGRDFYDLIWYMQKGVLPNPDRLKETHGQYTVRGAFDKLAEIVSKTKPGDLAADLNPLFEDGRFVERWIAAFPEEFASLRKKYE